MKKMILISWMVIALPTITTAATISDLINKANGWITSLGKLIFTSVIVAFFWGVLLFIFDREKKGEQAKSIMLWGVIAIFVMSSIWGIVSMLQSSTGINTGTKITGSNII